MAGWADKKPPGNIALFFKHWVKTIFVSTGWANFKLFLHLHRFDFVIHMKPSVEVWLEMKRMKPSAGLPLDFLLQNYLHFNFSALLLFHLRLHHFREWTLLILACAFDQ
jgi:hypothetical protein